MPQFTEATDIVTLKSVILPMRFCVYLKNSYLRVAITYFTFKYTSLLSKQCWIKRYILHDTIICNCIFIYPARTVVSVE